MYLCLNHHTKFTFHNVSINSVTMDTAQAKSFNLHSIMYLLIPRSTQNRLHCHLNLHSIMYLLIHLNSRRGKTNKRHLHSIMYLLIPSTSDKNGLGIARFTFHNVSINSPCFSVLSNNIVRFTFHNVSINSRPPTTIISSIVFLLFLSTSFYSPHLISIFLL